MDEHPRKASGWIDLTFDGIEITELCPTSRGEDTENSEEDGEWVKLLIDPVVDPDEAFRIQFVHDLGVPQEHEGIGVVLFQLVSLHPGDRMRAQRVQTVR